MEYEIDFCIEVPEGSGNIAEQMMKEFKEQFGSWDSLDLNLEDTVEKVIFNPPATIVILKDGTRAIVKTTEGDEFEPEIGFAMAMMKLAFGSRSSYKKWVDKWVKESQEIENKKHMKQFDKMQKNKIKKRMQELKDTLATRR